MLAFPISLFNMATANADIQSQRDYAEHSVNECIADTKTGGPSGITCQNAASNLVQLALIETSSHMAAIDYGAAIAMLEMSARSYIGTRGYGHGIDACQHALSLIDDMKSSDPPDMDPDKEKNLRNEIRGIELQLDPGGNY